MAERYKSALLFGAPGVGKGTQGKILAEIPGFFHLSCGDIFRSLDINSPEGSEIYRYSSRGELVPDQLTVRIWKRHVDALSVLSSYKPYEDLLVLDGIPRSVAQARLLEEHIEVLKIVHLKCSDQESMVHRIRRRAIRENRADDAQEDVIRRRFQVYEQETAPVLRHYDPALVEEIDGIGPPSEVLLKILTKLVPVQNVHFGRRAAVPAAT
jgi:adenylate kinase